MSGEVLARAPGKLFVLGEYAVLDGCPAVVAAVDRFVEVSLAWQPGNGVTEITSGAAHTRFANAELPLEAGPLRFVIAAIRSVLAQCPALAALDLALDITSRLTAADGAKLGLGSSAAVTAGVVAAMFAAAGRSLETRADRDELFVVALEAHRRVQGETGSGADVAASVYGGLILFQPLAPLAEIRLLDLPAGTRLLAAWTGEPASTPDLVQRYRAAGNGRAKHRAAFVDDSRAAVREFITALASGAVSLRALAANQLLLERLAADMALPLITPPLRDLIQVARHQGVAAKISGAGGGDCGIALVDDHQAEALRQAWEAAGLVPLDLNIAPEGVSVVRA